jgi:hypothetical protein
MTRSAIAMIHQARSAAMSRTSPHPASVARLDGRAVAALTCGVAGLFMFNIVFGPFAIVLGARAARCPSSRLGRTVGLLGVALGIADLVLLVVLVASRIHDGTFMWHAGR